MPSKNVRRFLYIVIAGFVFWFLWNFFVSLNTNNEKPSETISETLGIKSNQDTDGDGLYDWEEGLHNTNIRITDSDGDGISDGEEVRGGYDPAVFGQGVEIEVEPAKELFEETGFTLQIPPKNETNTGSDPIVPTESPAYTKYVPILNSMADVINTYPVLAASDTQTFSALFKPESSIEQERKRFEEIIGNYRLVASNLEKLSNKEGLQVEIIRLTQGYGRVADSLERLVTAYPLYAQNETEYVDSVIEYSNAVVSLQRQLYTVTEFIFAKSIRFKAGDSGSLFLFGG